MIVLKGDYLEKLTTLIPELSTQSSQKAWSSFVRLTGDDLHKYICYYLNDQEFASDILQEVYLAFLKDSEGFCKICEKEPDEIVNKKVYAWLYKTARHKALNYLKKKKITAVAHSQLNSKAQQMNTVIQSNSLEVKETNDLVKFELSQLNERQQNLLTLKFYLEKSNAEIAHEINCEVISVPKLIERALIQLKNRLEKSGIHLSISLIGELLTLKDMCHNLPPHILPITAQIYQAALTSGTLTKTILYKGILMKTLYTIVGVTLIGTLFFYNTPKTSEKPKLAQEKTTNNSPQNISALSPEAEKIIEKALENLSKSQNEDGSWKDSYGKNVGVNSLIILAFMSMGNYPEEGKYKEVVKKGVDWVISQSKNSGLIQNLEDGGGNAMYGHGFSTLMLSELWSHTKDSNIEEKLQKAIELIVNVQGPRGTWGYYAIAADGDTSVSAAQIIALSAAKKAGMLIPDATIPKSIDRLKFRFDAKNCMFGYGSPDNNIDSSNVGSHAAATSVMQVSGEKSHTYTLNPMNKNFEIIEKRKNLDGYFIYYGSISANQAGPEYYKKWCETVVPIINAKQKENGEIHDHLTTAWTVISLSMPLKYIKVYQPE